MKMSEYVAFDVDSSFLEKSVNFFPKTRAAEFVEFNLPQPATKMLTGVSSVGYTDTRLRKCINFTAETSKINGQSIRSHDSIRALLTQMILVPLVCVLVLWRR